MGGISLASKMFYFTTYSSTASLSIISLHIPTSTASLSIISLHIPTSAASLSIILLHIPTSTASLSITIAGNYRQQSKKLNIVHAEMFFSVSTLLRRRWENEQVLNGLLIQFYDLFSFTLQKWISGDKWRHYLYLILFSISTQHHAIYLLFIHIIGYILSFLITEEGVTDW